MGKAFVVAMLSLSNSIGKVAGLNVFKTLCTCGMVSLTIELIQCTCIQLLYLYHATS